MKIKNVVEAMESIAPLRLAADWDNVGLLIGDAETDVKKVMLCIDFTEAVLAEALAAKVQMVLAYHSVIFKAAPRLTALETPAAYAAARSGLAVYCPHTALDAADGGTNDVLAGVLGLTDARPLEVSPNQGKCKVVVFVQPDNLSAVAGAAFSAGAGQIGNYRDCAFFCHGIGSFGGGAGTHPTVGKVGSHEAVEEMRLEFVCDAADAPAVCAAVREAHSYEEPAIDVYPLIVGRAYLPDKSPSNAENVGQVCPTYGFGRIGRLNKPISADALIARIKKTVGVKRLLVARATPSPYPLPSRERSKVVKTAACCAGAGGSMLAAALRGGATFYLTGEMRHHDALAAASAGMTVVCTGHSNSERIALQPLANRLKKLLPKMKIAISRRDADPFEIE